MNTGPFVMFYMLYMYTLPTCILDFFFSQIETLNEEVSSHEDAENSMKQQVTELKSKLNEQFHISYAAIEDRKMFCQQYKEMKVFTLFFRIVVHFFFK